MTSGQMMLTTGAMILLGITVLSVNQNHIQQGTILRQTELGIYAVSLATSYVEKASGMNFDEKFPLTVSLGTSQLTPAGNLGRDASEIKGVDSTFDDFDDYNQFDNMDSVANVDAFRVQASVSYVDQNPPYGKTSIPWWFKQIDIRVSNSGGRRIFESVASDTTSGVDTIKFSYIFTYFK